MAPNDSGYNPSDNNDESDVDKVSVTSSDSDVEDHIILSDRMLLLGDVKKKRNKGFFVGRRHPNGAAMPWLRTKCSIVKVNSLKKLITNPSIVNRYLKCSINLLPYWDIPFQASIGWFTGKSSGPYRLHFLRSNLY